MEARVISCTTSGDDKVVKIAVPNHHAIAKYKAGENETTIVEMVGLTWQVVCCHAINFSQLIECTIFSLQFDWLQPFMCFLQNSPQLKVLLIDQLDGDFPLSFIPPSSVPGCLSTHLEMFEWKGYRGRNGEKEVVKYILANSKYLKRAAITIKPCSLENKKKMIKELKSVSRVSPLSRLLFSPLKWIPRYSTY
ncbi:PREDICTED: putative F-box/FBD/LRR-repeat protein At1g22000 [Camelina sativa]|uniref:F-box/FBD/LRR-repeat protein At1g22000 n=1 Tax=Camelina sativa TaxID=90675 RepID=A0ABM1Q703_CAMSA|nr:PREDICTED: putative F-box/FBD/LRR-repeat protein At1g22000 [Camelina sativa]